MAKAEEAFREARADWLADRIVYAAEHLGIDVDVLMTEMRERGWMPSAIMLEWPAGLTLADEPQLRDYFSPRRKPL